MHWNLDTATWSRDLEFIYFNEIALNRSIGSRHQSSWIQSNMSIWGFAGQLFFVVGLYLLILLFKHYYLRLGNQMFSLAGDLLCKLGRCATEYVSFLNLFTKTTHTLKHDNGFRVTSFCFYFKNTDPFISDEDQSYCWVLWYCEWK